MGTMVNAARKVYHAARKVAGVRSEADLNPFPIDAWTDRAYTTWFESHKATAEELGAQRAAAGQFALQPSFSFIVPLYKTPLDFLEVMASSVLSQTYGILQLVLVNASPELPSLAAAVHALELRDARVTVVTLEKNLGITENTNAGLEVATGDFCCFLDHDDYIDADLLFEYVRAINEDPTIDFLYCDEDLVLEDKKKGGFRHQNPFLKPDYSPELLLCKNAIVHLMTIRKTIIESMPKPGAEFDGSQDYNMALYCSSAARAVRHVPRVMYHWRISENSTATNPDSKPYSLFSCRKAQELHYERIGTNATIASSGLYLLHNPWFGKVRGRVSVVVDVADAVGEISAAYSLLEQFVEFFRQGTSYEDVEVLLVSSRAGESEHEAPFRVVRCETGDGLLARLNVGAAAATGDYLIFVDAGCFFVTPEAVEQLIGLCGLAGVGVAAPKTLYRNGRNKTYGVAVTPKRIMPLYRGYEGDFPGYQCYTRGFLNVSACGWQGLTISRELFEHVGGFDERFEGEVGAADLCRRVLSEDLRVAQTCTVKLRTNDACPERYYVEPDNAPDYPEADVRLFDEKWPSVRAAGDPYYSPNLDQASGYCKVARTSKGRH